MHATIILDANCQSCSISQPLCLVSEALIKGFDLVGVRSGAQLGTKLSDTSSFPHPIRRDSVNLSVGGSRPMMAMVPGMMSVELGECRLSLVNDGCVTWQLQPFKVNTRGWESNPGYPIPLGIQQWYTMLKIVNKTVPQILNHGVMWDQNRYPGPNSSVTKVKISQLTIRIITRWGPNVISWLWFAIWQANHIYQSRLIPSC